MDRKIKERLITVNSDMGVMFRKNILDPFLVCRGLADTETVKMFINSPFNPNNPEFVRARSVKRDVQ